MFLGLAFRLLREEIKINEDLDFGAQYLGHHRRDHVIYRPQRVALAGADLVGVIGGDENDGDVLGFGAPAYERRRLQTVKPRHVDVQQDHREVLAQDMLQRFFAGRRGDEILAEIFQNGAEDDVLIRPIVDHEDIGLADTV